MSVKEPPALFYGYKALTLAPISSTAKAVGGVLLDHYNSKTRRLDPSVTSMARRLGIQRKTVIKATGDLVQIGLFTKQSHGGHAYRASYEPNFAMFRTMVTDFERRRKGSAAPAETSPLHPKNRPPTHAKLVSKRGPVSKAKTGVHKGTAVGVQMGTAGGPQKGTQTLRINSSNLTQGAQPEKTVVPEVSRTAATGHLEGPAAVPPSGQSEQTVNGLDEVRRFEQIRAARAERDAAIEAALYSRERQEGQHHRRAAKMAIHRALIRRDRDVYKRAVAVPEHPAWAAAFDAEMATQGSGAGVVLAAFATGPPPPLRVVDEVGDDA